jgi:hypothetical protein
MFKIVKNVPPAIVLRDDAELDLPWRTYKMELLSEM